MTSVTEHFCGLTLLPALGHGANGHDGRDEDGFEQHFDWIVRLCECLSYLEEKCWSLSRTRPRGSYTHLLPIHHHQPDIYRNKSNANPALTTKRTTPPRRSFHEADLPSPFASSNDPASSLSGSTRAGLMFHRRVRPPYPCHQCNPNRTRPYVWPSCRAPAVGPSGQPPAPNGIEQRARLRTRERVGAGPVYRVWKAVWRRVTVGDSPCY